MGKHAGAGIRGPIFGFVSSRTPAPVIGKACLKQLVVVRTSPKLPLTVSLRPGRDPTSPAKHLGPWDQLDRAMRPDVWGEVPLFGDDRSLK